jgi:glucose/arabinose dehydrogenase
MRRMSSVAAGSIAAALALIATGCSSGSDDVEPAETFETVPPSEAPAASAADDATPSADTNPADTGQPVDTQPDTGAPTTVATPATTLATAAPLVEPAVELVPIATFARPVGMAVRPDDARLFVIEQSGTVTAADDEGTTVVLDVSDRITTAGDEQGLLGLAFHPALDLAYVDFTNTEGDTVVAEFAVDPASATFDPASYREVLTVDQPYPNHNGGQLAFGPDGLLYIGLGDGGAAGDPERHALDLSSRLGKILRIDPASSGGEPFTVPADNPFVATTGADPTIWSYGLRNPWRFSFDPVNGDLWIADVGQNQFEEIDHVAATGGVDAGKGSNFGWSAFEGDAPFNADQSPDGAIAPVYVYSHDAGGCSVSGGAVAGPDAVGGLAGWYVFGDYCTGEILALDPASVQAGTEPRVVTIGNLAELSAISAGVGGDLYAISNSGDVARFAPA